MTALQIFLTSISFLPSVGFLIPRYFTVKGRVAPLRKKLEKLAELIADCQKKKLEDNEEMERRLRQLESRRIM